MSSWQVDTTHEFDEWIASIPRREQERVVAAKLLLAQEGPGLGRPFVDTVKGSRYPNMKELRRGTIRILFAFDPERTAVLLVGGDKKGKWREWYRTAIAEADRLFERHLRGLKR